MVGGMKHTAVHDIRDLSNLLERAASIHAGAGVRDHRSLIEDFVGLIRDFDPGAASGDATCSQPERPQAPTATAIVWRGSGALVVDSGRRDLESVEPLTTPGDDSEPGAVDLDGLTDLGQRPGCGDDEAPDRAPVALG